MDRRRPQRKRPRDVVVPDLLGLSPAEAAGVAVDAGLRAAGPDGEPESLRDLQGTVVRQQPEPGAVTRARSAVLIWTSGPGGGAGVREPRRPVPPARGGTAEPARGTGTTAPAG